MPITEAVAAARRKRKRHDRFDMVVSILLVAGFAIGISCLQWHWMRTEGLSPRSTAILLLASWSCAIGVTVFYFRFRFPRH